LGVNSEDDQIVAVLVGYQKVSASQVNPKVSWRFALSGLVTDGSQLPFTVNGENGNAVMPAI
jgi:hypothetical protein